MQSTQLEYSATLTGASFLFFEFKQVVQLREQGLSDLEIRERVLSDNVFQYGKKSSLQRSLPSIIRRVNVLDETLRNMVLEDSMNSGKVINLYAIMKTDRLFFEFMNEVIREKFEQHTNLLEKKDLNLYFIAKTEQDEGMASWSEQTVNKLKQVLLRILHESGILKNKKTGELNRLLVNEKLKNHLINVGDSLMLRAMGEKVRVNE